MVHTPHAGYIQGHLERPYGMLDLLLDLGISNDPYQFTEVVIRECQSYLAGRDGSHNTGACSLGISNYRGYDYHGVQGN